MVSSPGGVRTPRGDPARTIRQNRARGFVDAMLEGGPRTAGLLERLDAATPWREIAAPIYQLPEYTNPGPKRLGARRGVLLVRGGCRDA